MWRSSSAIFINENHVWNPQECLYRTYTARRGRRKVGATVIVPLTPKVYIWIESLRLYKVGYRNSQYKKRGLSAVYTRFHPTSIFWEIDQNLWKFLSQNCDIRSFPFLLKWISLVMGSILSYQWKNIVRKKVIFGLFRNKIHWFSITLQICVILCLSLFLQSNLVSIRPNKTSKTC